MEKIVDRSSLPKEFWVRHDGDVRALNHFVNDGRGSYRHRRFVQHDGALAEHRADLGPRRFDE